MPFHIETTCLPSKGQVVLPSGIRNARHWKAGTGFEIQETPESVLLKPLATSCEPRRIEDVAGCLKPRRARVSLKEMDKVIATEVRERYARSRY
jgi:AbrB family looped-hinge helix DNA binding protein